MKRFLLTALLGAICNAGAFAQAYTVDATNYLYRINQSGSYSFSSLPQYYRIFVAENVTATISINGVTIDARGSQSIPQGSALMISNGANVTLKLSGTNTLRGGQEYAGVQVGAGATLTITSAAGDGSTSGTLNAYSGHYGAAIGGMGGQSAGNITIKGGTIYAEALRTIADNYNCGAGIGNGGAFDSNNTLSGGTITITGGNVTAKSATRGAGIGGGFRGHSGNITISGGTVTATAGGMNGAGIGSGTSGHCNNITISGGTVTATGGTSATGIGDGLCQSNNLNSTGVITISGGTVKAYTPGGTYYPAAIGGGGNVAVRITGGVVVAVADGDGPDIGCGSLIIAEENHSQTITITGGTTIANNIGNNTSSLTVPSITNNLAVFFNVGWSNSYFKGVADIIPTGNPKGATGTLRMTSAATLQAGVTLTLPTGWTLDCNGYPITNYGTLVGTVGCPTYLVSFNMNGHSGAAPGVLNIARGGKTGTLPTPSSAPTGYKFDGWYKEAGCTNAWNANSDVVMGNVTLYAKWTLKSVAVTYSSNGGTSTAAGGSTSGTYGGVLSTAPTTLPTKTGYTVAGWYASSALTGSAWVFGTGGTALTPANGVANADGSPTLTLYAKWTPKTVAVTYNTNGESNVNGTTGTYGSALATAPTVPTKSGYSFGGWYASSTFNGAAWAFGASGTALTEANGVQSAAGTPTLTLYAKWYEGGSGTTTINIDIDMGKNGPGWTFTPATSPAVLTIAESGTYTIRNANTPATTNRVVVSPGVTANITLNAVNVDVSSIADACAFNMTGATVHLTLTAGTTSTLKSAGTSAGVMAPAGATLTIASGAGAGSTSGTLTAYGGYGTGAHSGAGNPCLSIALRKS